MMHVAKDVNLDQLAEEIQAKVGQRVPVMAQHDPVTLKPVAVDAETDEEVLASCVEDHVAVWPPPPPDPVDLLNAALAKSADPIKIRAALREHLIPILRDLRERRD